MATSLTESAQDELQMLKVTPGVFNIKHEEDEDYRGTVIKVVDAEHITAGTHTFSLVRNYRDGFDAERFGQRFESILNKYDYVVGDWGFEQLRLRGFYNDKNHSANRDQTISTLQDYLLEFCNFGCAFFVLQNNAPERAHPDSHQTDNKPTHHNANHHSTNKQVTHKSTNSNQKRPVNQTHTKLNTAAARHDKPTTKSRDNQKNKSTKPRTNQKSTHVSNQRSSATQTKPVVKKQPVDNKRPSTNKTTAPRQHEFHIRKLDK